MILSLLTPVLGSLTVAFSDDTIILDYVIFVFIHLLYYDFELINSQPDWSVQQAEVKNDKSTVGAAETQSPSTSGVSGVPPPSSNTKVTPKPEKKVDSTKVNVVQYGSPTSINAIFFASILLGSRLKKTSKVFTLLYISLCTFGFIPIFRHLMRHRMRWAYDSYALISSILLGYFIFK